MLFIGFILADLNDLSIRETENDKNRNTKNSTKAIFVDTDQIEQSKHPDKMNITFGNV